MGKRESKHVQPSSTHVDRNDNDEEDGDPDLYGSSKTQKPMSLDLGWRLKGRVDVQHCSL